LLEVAPSQEEIGRKEVVDVAPATSSYILATDLQFYFSIENHFSFSFSWLFQQSFLYYLALVN